MAEKNTTTNCSESRRENKKQETAFDGGNVGAPAG